MRTAIVRAGSNDAMTPSEFITKWRASELKESSAAQEHFIDLCRLLGERRHRHHRTVAPLGIRDQRASCALRVLNRHRVRHRQRSLHEPVADPPLHEPDLASAGQCAQLRAPIRWLSQSTSSRLGGAVKARARASMIAFLFPMIDPFRSRVRRGPVRPGRGTCAGNVQDTAGNGVTDRGSKGFEGARRSVTTAATRCHHGLGA